VKAREPQGPIQRPFYGLIGLLDLKGSELSPNTIEGSIRGAVDVEPYLLAGLLQWREAPIAMDPLVLNSEFNSSSNRLIVPEGRVWLVREITVALTVATPDTLDALAVAIAPSAYNNGSTTIAQVRGPWAGSIDILAVCPFVGPLVLPAGFEIGFGFSGYDGIGGTSAGRIKVRYAQVVV